MTVTRASVSGNHTGPAGSTGGFRGGNGGSILNGAALTMINSTVADNITHGNLADGGGVYNGGNLMSLTNCTISNNQANPVNDSSGGRGGGLYTAGNSALLTNVTITGNSAYTCCSYLNGQGVVSTGGVTVRNSIIAGNGNAGMPDVTGDFTSQGHNIIGVAKAGDSSGGNGDQTGFTNGVSGDKVGTAASPIDPKLGPLADNGGPTKTNALLAGSPALDAGDNSRAKDPNNVALTTDSAGSGATGARGTS